MLSKSFWFKDTIDPDSTGIPSKTYRGVLPAVNEPTPLNLTEDVADGSPDDV